MHMRLEARSLHESEFRATLLPDISHHPDTTTERERILQGASFSHPCSLFFWASAHCLEAYSHFNRPAGTPHSGTHALQLTRTLIYVSHSPTRMTAQTESSLEVQLPLPRWTIEGLGDPPRVGFSYSKHCVSAPRKQAWHELAGECRWVPQKHPLGARDGWFYRFSASVVEVFRKENGPLDKLHVLDVLGLPRFDEWGGEIRVTAKFTAAAAGIIEGRPTLVLCIHDSATDTTSVYLNEIFGRRWQKLDCGIKQPVKFVEITQSWESQQLSPFMVFATNEELFAISVSDPQRDEAVDEVSPTFRVVAPLPRARSVGDITSLGTHCDQNDSRLIVFTGSIMGRVDVWRVNSGNKPRIEKLSNFMVGERHMPVVEMLLRDDGQRGGPGTLFVSQSVTKGRGSGDVAKPSISVLPLDAYYAKKDSHATIFPIGEDLGAVVGMNVVASPYGARIFSVVNMYLGVRKTTVLAVTDLSSNGRIKKTTHRPIFNSSSKQVDIEPKGVTACTVLTAGRKIHFFFPPAEPKPVEPKRLVNLADKFVSGSGSFLYKPEKRDSIAKTRAMFDNDLFADILQYRVAPDAPEFPPQNLQELCDLLKHIDACDADPRHKNRFVLYLLKDLKNGEDRAFANERGMDAQDRNEIQAFWALDHGNFKEATELLCEPGAFRSGKLAIETQYSEKIVKVLVLHGEIRYAKRYVAISRPELSSDEGAQLDMILKITTDLFEAIQVQRPYSGTPLGDRLWHMLMEATFKYIEKIYGGTAHDAFE
ncbi:nuclear pore complex assembly-domain-containing protein [Fimicolochytrium jonesii]|uniref:nuclear pore complex assembly-domain-containing protein n=1 Tax=Fimicolochytrium jonesii TaxID=1396493 RepID=UPI0022FEF819|nr:nuclear pore complex assembly-domain-containing protein [Fimicolochytrium jonesii]KAI8819379.1 nuclear pore complex assembly-domain-containing protein [Fimicolochytrium jonesii]